MEITTRRLLLRPLALDLLESTHAYASDPENTRYMVFLPNESLEETEQFICGAMTEWASPDPTFYEFAIMRNGVHIGGVSLSVDRTTMSGELGWIIRRACWGHGYAGEAAAALIEHAARCWGIHRFVAHCDAGNAASRRTMEKLGMRRISCSGGRKNRASQEERLELMYELDV